MFESATILITGGTGPFGNTFVPLTFAIHNIRKLITFSRDEMKKREMGKQISSDTRARFLIGDGREKVTLEELKGMLEAAL
jgi:UDP-N-acetylglucosamine 4,6-dehydratase